MCKLLGIVEIGNQKDAELFARAAIPIVTKSDNHGLGIMRLGERGVYVQRWLNPETATRRMEDPIMAKYNAAVTRQHNSAGVPSKRLDALAIHGRFATCERTLANVHPFVREGTALMHNGVINNSYAYETVVSTCDSEALLTQYLKHGVWQANGNLSDALHGVEGYQAAIVFNDTGVIDIWRDAMATLYIARVKHVGVVLATTPAIIQTTAKRCGLRVSGLDEIMPMTHIRWQRGRNPVISTFRCDQPARTYDSRSAAEIIQRHQANVSDAQSLDADTPWYLRDGKVSEDDEPDYPVHLYDTRQRGVLK